MVNCDVKASADFCDVNCLEEQQNKDCANFCERQNADCDGSISYEDAFHLHVQCGSWEKSYELELPKVSSKDNCKKFKTNTTALECGSCWPKSIKIWIENTKRLCDVNQGEQLAVCKCKTCYYRSWTLCCDRLYCGCKVLDSPTTTVSPSTTEAVTTTTSTVTTRPSYRFSQTVSEVTNKAPQTREDNPSPAIGGAVGGSIAVLLVLVVLIVLFCWFRRVRAKKLQQNETYNNLGRVSYHNRAYNNINSIIPSSGSQALHPHAEYDYVNSNVVQPRYQEKDSEETYSPYANSPEKGDQDVSQHTYQEKDQAYSPYANIQDRMDQDDTDSFKTKLASPDNPSGNDDNYFNLETKVESPDNPSGNDDNYFNLETKVESPDNPSGNDDNYFNLETKVESPDNPSGNDDNYFKLEPVEVNGEERTPELVDKINNNDKIAANVDDEETYNELNESKVTQPNSTNNEYDHVKNGWGSIVGDYDQLQKHSERSTVGPNDNYDHCKPINHTNSADTVDDMSDENYDRLH